MTARACRVVNRGVAYKHGHRPLPTFNQAICARAANYSENKRGFSMLVIQNGRTVFEHSANGGSARTRAVKSSAATKKFLGDRRALRCPRRFDQAR